MDARSKIRKFLDMELTAETEEFDKKFSANACHLLNETEELFIGQFIKFNNGEMIVRFKASRSFPRKGEYTQAMYLPKVLQNYHLWNNCTYEFLFKNRLKGSEAVCIWQTKAEQDGFVLLGFHGVDISFAEFISQAPGALLFFGPLHPPIEYLTNLYKCTDDEYSESISDILDYSYVRCDNPPTLLKGDNPHEFLLRQLSSANVTILQGPPGTGKTHLISEICERLCSEGKSVLVTALTNRALLEVASKESLRALLSEGRIYKSNITADESNELPALRSMKQLRPMNGVLALATYYIVSGFAAEVSEDGAFDVVIMDEASQALLPMFASVRKIGISNLWVGDTEQLGPVIALNQDRIIQNCFSDYVEGLQTVTTKRIYPFFQLTNTYRLTQRSADYTGFFYNKSLISKSIISPFKITSLHRILHKDGGPTLILTDLEIGSATPQLGLDIATFIVSSILSETSKLDVAVLTCFRKSARALQKAISVQLGINNKVLIDTIARVQGLTTDITLFFIPNTSMNRSLEKRLFNVATSRAKHHSIIIADKNVLSFPNINTEVRNYLAHLAEESCLYIPANLKTKKIQ